MGILYLGLSVMVALYNCLARYPDPLLSHSFVIETATANSPPFTGSPSSGLATRVADHRSCLIMHETQLGLPSLPSEYWRSIWSVRDCCFQELGWARPFSRETAYWLVCERRAGGTWADTSTWEEFCLARRERALFECFFFTECELLSPTQLLRVALLTTCVSRRRCWMPSLLE